VGNYLSLLVFLVIAVAFVVATLGVSRLFRVSNPYGEKRTTVECGERTIGPTWVKFHLGYYVIVMLFLVFEVEGIFLYPWAVIFKPLLVNYGFFAFGEMFLFIFILLIGLVYAWRKGVLRWIY
jgi:NADH-quinone oxidoreductase subunit A